MVQICVVAYYLYLKRDEREYIQNTIQTTLMKKICTYMYVYKHVVFWFLNDGIWVLGKERKCLIVSQFEYTQCIEYSCTDRFN